MIADATINALLTLYNRRFIPGHRGSAVKCFTVHIKAMYARFFHLFWRRAGREPLSFIINVIGLSTALCCAVLIYLWVRDEKSIDSFHDKKNRLFIILKNADTPEGITTFDETPGLLAATLSGELPTVEYAVALMRPQRENKKGTFTSGRNRVEAVDLCVSRDFFNVFSFPLLQGNRAAPFSTFNDVLLSEELALKLFNTTTDILGRQLEWERQSMSGVYRVAGVFKNPPLHSTLQFDVLFNYELFLQKNGKLLDWRNGGPNTYVVLKKEAEPASFNKAIRTFLNQKGGREALFAQPFSKRYLSGNYENGQPSGGRITYVRIFSAIGIFILLIACINFVNISTATTTKRLKEVGVKKIMGAGRRSLVVQLMCDSMLIALSSMLLALLPIWLLLPSFNEVSGKQIAFSIDRSLLQGMALLVMIVALLSGLYPALYLSSFKPVKIFKSPFLVPHGGALLRRALVVFQFSISAIMIISVIVLYKQVGLIQSKNLGYRRDNLLYLEPKTGQPEAFNSLLAAVRNVPGVTNAASFRHNIAAGREGGTTDIQWPGKDADLKIQFTDIAGGYGFIETMGIALMQGRSYSAAFGDETSKIIFNEEAIAVMGLSDPVGKTVTVWGEKKQIIGIVKNFHFQSLYEKIKPCFIELSDKIANGKIMARITPEGQAETIERIRQVCRLFSPGLPFEFRFVDNDYQAMYESENRIKILSGYFAVVVIVISCLGLFGLAAFTVQRRAREIGIRKVLGSGSWSILLLLVKEFGAVILVSLLLAMPLAFMILSHWLDSFAYRVELSFLYFLAAASLIFLISLFSVGMQTIKAIFIDPAVTLRSE